MLLRRYRRARDGAVAVEFALVAPLFLALIFSIIEVGWLFLRVSTLEDAVADVSRSIYTGMANDQAGIEAEVCQRVASVISDCPNNIAVELRVIDDAFTPPAGGATCIDATDPALATFTPVVTYQNALGDQTVFVRVCLTTDVISPILKFSLNVPRNERGRLQLVSTFAFRNEPF